MPLLGYQHDWPCPYISPEKKYLDYVKEVSSRFESFVKRFAVLTEPPREIQ